MKKMLKLGIPVAISLQLVACGGGGGGGGGATAPSATIGSFTRFSDVTAGTPVRMTGSSQQVSYTWDSSTNKITTLGVASAFAPTATLDLTSSTSGSVTPSRMVLTSAGGTTITLSTAAGDSFGALAASLYTGTAVSAAADKLILFAAQPTWNYQTFGVWATGIDSGSGTAGSFSVGTLTAGANIPTSGSGNYVGSAGGRYVDPAGNYYYTFASMTAAADFGARSIAFSTTGTTQTGANGGATFTVNPALNLSGTLSYTAGTNQFTGNVSSVGGGTGNAAMTGTATGNFYGPAAEEIGGGFSVRGTGVSGFMGSFGGKK